MNSESSGPGDKSRFIDIFYFMMLVEFRCFTCTGFSLPFLCSFVLRRGGGGLGVCF